MPALMNSLNSCSLIHLFFKDRNVTDIFGAYYDEGRIANCIAANSTWGILGRRSMETFDDIQKASGKYYINIAAWIRFLVS